MQTVEEFIAERVNASRGGYPPEEVAALIRDAWDEAKLEASRQIADSFANGFRTQRG